ncbi:MULTISPECIES: ABC transporter ATP-binding protein [unclassified Bacillus (in: firmicutes)]|uniref:ABC transporter ATP-binding protein n=1 Tax=unclassified Bacillus (in: firmicutes) TaxID=185979 RepID=UPI00040E6639|nr:MULTISPECIES: ABC transporter ATP-binding protein [unclassified Bacillus (in: firmicutes)]QHZ45528.1 ABC transporter ATP-binding protein [Bacillus sp. NSP9.1]WFA04667.1 ABC transporter ATP-binding protein [Bacillus sp. HSf4]
MNVVIEANGLTKSYGAKTVVNKVDLQVEKGEIYGFLGRNGAGKSTFMNMITGITQPSAGSFRLLNESSLEKVKHRIGVLPDYSMFYDSLTAVGHLKYFAKLNGCRASTKRCETVLERVGLLEDGYKKAGRFSFGMKKKLGIAQAIIHDPELIFLDEPTSGVDAESALYIHKLLIDLQKEGKTIFMTSHNLYEIEKMCTRIAIMKNGSILKEGTIDELRKHFMSNISVQIRHSDIPDQHFGLINGFLESAGEQLEYRGREISIIVNSEEKIPAIVRVLTNCKVGIYRIHVDEPSLEEIFLDDTEKSSVSSI